MVELTPVSVETYPTNIHLTPLLYVSITLTTVSAFLLSFPLPISVLTVNSAFNIN